MPLSDRFDIEPPLHVGQIATAYPAVQRDLHRRVLLKVLHPQWASDSELVERFLREGQSMARVNHPNVVRVYDCGRDDPAGAGLFLVLEWIEGGTLDLKLRGGPLPPKDVRGIAEDVLNGLAAVHREGLLHRDLKPDNIMIDRDGRAILTDFSLASLAKLPALTSHGALIGTPAYMAPELLDGHVADVRSDLYSLGIVLLEALTGSNPFRAADPLMSLDLIRRNRPPKLMGRIAADPNLAGLVDKLLEADPQNRPESAEECLALLTGIDRQGRLSSQAFTDRDADAPNTGGTPVPPSIRRWKWYAAAAAAVWIAAIVYQFNRTPAAPDLRNC